MEHEPLVAHASAKDAPVGSSSSTARRVGLAVAGLAAAGVLAFSGKMTMSTIKTKSAEADLAEMPKLADDAFATPTKFVPDGNNWKVRPDVMNYAALKPNYAEMNEEAKKSKFDQFVTVHSLSQLLPPWGTLHGRERIRDGHVRPPCAACTSTPRRVTWMPLHSLEQGADCQLLQLLTAQCTGQGRMSHASVSK